jgi:hypothetical protein
MKNFFTLFFLLFCFQANYAQKQYYLDRQEKVCSKAQALYYIKIDSSENGITERRMNLRDSVCYVIQYNLDKNNNRRLNGKFYKCYKSGKIHFEADYKWGFLSGFLKEYDIDGNTLRIDSCQGNSLISGKCFNFSGQEIPYFSSKSNAIYREGDINTYRIHMQSIINSSYFNVAGKVRVQFCVSPFGKIENIKIIESPDQQLSDLVLKAMEKSEIWQPALIDRMAVPQVCVIPIIFQLE